MNILEIIYKEVSEKRSADYIAKKYNLEIELVESTINDVIYPKLKENIFKSRRKKSKYNRKRIETLSKSPKRIDLIKKQFFINKKQGKNVLLNQFLKTKINVLYDLTIEYNYHERFIDFVFVEDTQLLAIDIDKDFNSDENIEKYNQLKYHGWKVMCLDTTEIMEDFTNVYSSILANLNYDKAKQFRNGDDKNTIPFRVEKPISVLKKEFNKDNASYNSLVSSVLKRKYERPSYKELKDYLKKRSYRDCAKHYNVSLRTIQNWIKWYEKYN